MARAGRVRAAGQRILRGEGMNTPSLPLALALARFFGVTVEEMFDDQGS
jgi:DNA-binding XRE family transcriptional regulator